MEWSKDKMKNDEVFANTLHFKYCIKCFKTKKQVELWETRKGGHKKSFETEKEAMMTYRYLKRLNEEKMLGFIKKNFTKIKR